MGRELLFSVADTRFEIYLFRVVYLFVPFFDV